MVAGTVVLSADRQKVLLISSAASPDRWVIPKGGMESDEAGPEASALRETWEEAGVLGKISRPLGIITDSRPPKTWKGQSVKDATATWPPRSEFHFFELIFDRAEQVFPECKSRQRMWTNYSDAIQKLTHRPELREAVMRSSLKQD